MSDFLDRLAARAIGSETAGGETVLAPRLPSLFEPMQRAPIMPFSDAGETAPEHHETAAVSAVTTTAPARSPHAPVAATADAARGAPVAVEPGTAPSPMRATPGTPGNVPQPSPKTALPAPSAVVERSVTLPMPPEALAARPVRPRQTRRIVMEQPEPGEPSRSEANGALLAASTPVFGTTRVAEAPGRSFHATAMRPLAAPAGPGNASSEPVVHVSIGRLEVRAAPAAATAPHRHDGPQPSSLDDYLRQRAKASP